VPPVLTQSGLIERNILSYQPGIGISPKGRYLIQLTEEAGWLGTEIREVAAKVFSGRSHMQCSQPEA
jgi:hypothetical protein